MIVRLAEMNLVNNSGRCSRHLRVRCGYNFVVILMSEMGEKALYTGFQGVVYRFQGIAYRWFSSINIGFTYLG